MLVEDDAGGFIWLEGMDTIDEADEAGRGTWFGSMA